MQTDNSLLQVTVEIEEEEDYLSCLLEEVKCDNSPTHQAILNNAIEEIEAKIAILKAKQRILHKETSAFVASLGLPTYKLP